MKGGTGVCFIMQNFCVIDWHKCTFSDFYYATRDFLSLLWFICWTQKGKIWKSRVVFSFVRWYSLASSILTTEGKISVFEKNTIHCNKERREVKCLASCNEGGKELRSELNEQDILAWWWRDWRKKTPMGRGRKINECFTKSFSDYEGFIYQQKNEKQFAFEL